MIRNLVFDYGGVVVNVHGSVVRRAFMDLRVARWKQILYYRRIKRLKDDFIDGVRPAEEVLNEIHALCGRGVSRSQLSQVMGLLAGELPPERIRTIASLREKYRVYVLSNINDSLWQTSVRQIEALGLSVADCFDATFLSYEMGGGQTRRGHLSADDSGDGDDSCRDSLLRRPPQQCGSRSAPWFSGPSGRQQSVGGVSCFCPPIG